MATRNASADTINALAAGIPELFGGSADLSESNLTDVKGGGDFTAAEAGRNLRFGVREHGMGGIANGIAYHGGFRPYVGHVPDLLRLHARQRPRWPRCPGSPSIYVWTHDSVGLGEDGPTHQPVEHYAALRAIPNLWFVRPADANETAAAWALALERTDGPTALALTRQKLPVLPGTADGARGGRPARRVRAPGRVDGSRPAARPTSSSSPRAPRSSSPSPPPKPSRPRGSRRASSASPAGRPSRPRTRRTARACSRRR